MKEKIDSLKHTIKVILIIAAAIVAAILIWQIVAFVTSITIHIIEFVILAIVVYAVFLVARSALRGKGRTA
ncbi:MAG: hypothetical protein ACRDFX_06485 [Chloroflexota bacterium]